jgi:hypothetical protein
MIKTIVNQNHQFKKKVPAKSIASSTKYGGADTQVHDQAITDQAKEIARQKGLAEERGYVSYIARHLQYKQTKLVNRGDPKKLKEFYSKDMGRAFDTKMYNKIYGLYQDGAEMKQARAMDLKVGDNVYNNFSGDMGILQDCQRRGDMMRLVFQDDRIIMADALEGGWGIYLDNAPVAASSAQGPALFREQVEGEKNTETKKKIDKCVCESLPKAKQEVFKNVHAPGNGFYGQDSNEDSKIVTPAKEEDVDPKELKIGVEIEHEHTDDPKEAKKIALQHLAENKNYYTKLKKYVEPDHADKPETASLDGYGNFIIETQDKSTFIAPGGEGYAKSWGAQTSKIQQAKQSFMKTTGFEKDTQPLNIALGEHFKSFKPATDPNIIGHKTLVVPGKFKEAGEAISQFKKTNVGLFGKPKPGYFKHSKTDNISQKLAMVGTQSQIGHLNVGGKDFTTVTGVKTKSFDFPGQIRKQPQDITPKRSGFDVLKEGWSKRYEELGTEITGHEKTLSEMKKMKKDTLPSYQALHEKVYGRQIDGKVVGGLKQKHATGLEGIKMISEGKVNLEKVFTKAPESEALSTKAIKGRLVDTDLQTKFKSKEEKTKYLKPHQPAGEGKGDQITRTAIGQRRGMDPISAKPHSDKIQRPNISEETWASKFLKANVTAYAGYNPGSAKFTYKEASMGSEFPEVIAKTSKKGLPIEAVMGKYTSEADKVSDTSALKSVGAKADVQKQEFIKGRISEKLDKKKMDMAMSLPLDKSGRSYKKIVQTSKGHSYAHQLEEKKTPRVTAFTPGAKTLGKKSEDVMKHAYFGFGTRMKDIISSDFGSVPETQTHALSNIHGKGLKAVKTEIPSKMLEGSKKLGKEAKITEKIDKPISTKLTGEIPTWEKVIGKPPKEKVGHGSTFKDKID